MNKEKWRQEIINPLKDFNKHRAENRAKNPQDTIDLKGINLNGSDLTKIDFMNLDLSGANLKGANLEKAGFIKTKLEDADLSGANLKEANFYKADLSGVDLTNANLEKVCFSLADLSRADFTGANFERTQLSGAILMWVRGLPEDVFKDWVMAVKASINFRNKEE